MLLTILIQLRHWGFVLEIKGYEPRY